MACLNGNAVFVNAAKFWPICLLCQLPPFPTSWICQKLGLFVLVSANINLFLVVALHWPQFHSYFNITRIYCILCLKRPCLEERQEIYISKSTVQPLPSVTSSVEKTKLISASKLIPHYPQNLKPVSLFLRPSTLWFYSIATGVQTVELLLKCVDQECKKKSYIAFDSAANAIRKRHYFTLKRSQAHYFISSVMD